MRCSAGRWQAGSRGAHVCAGFFISRDHCIIRRASGRLLDILRFRTIVCVHRVVGTCEKHVANELMNYIIWYGREVQGREHNAARLEADTRK
jgi:hypothetical protein